MKFFSSSQRLQSIFLMLMVCFILVFSSNVSALEFDNVKSYDPNLKVVTITNAFGLGDVIGQARLLSKQNEILGAGYQNVSMFEIWAYEDYNDAIKQFTFTDMKKKEKINRDFDLKMLGHEEVEVNDYISECYMDYSNSTNGTQVCEQIINGTHTEIKEVWTKITPADLKKNEVLTIGVFTNVQIEDHVDWIPTIYGVEVEEWAEWTQDLNVDLEAYYPFEEGSGTTSEDVANGHNMTGFNTPGWTASGKIGNATDLESSNSEYWKETTASGDFSFNGSFTINAWVKPESFTSWATISALSTDPSTGGSRWRMFQGDPSNYNRVYSRVVGTDYAQSSTAQSTGTWYMITYVHNSSGFFAYTNGVEDGVLLNSGAFDPIVELHEMSIGAFYETGSWQYLFDGPIDEVGIWGRQLSPTEIGTQLYNNGTGITWTDVFAFPPKITLTSPANNSNLTSSSQDFIATVTDDSFVQNVSLKIDGAIVSTNTSNVNGTYLFSETITEGFHNWSILAYDNASDSNESEVWFFNYTEPPISIDLQSPTDVSTHQSPPVNMSCIAYDPIGVEQLNLTVFGDTQIVVTNSTPGENLSISQFVNFSEGNYTWGCSAKNYMTSATSSNRTFEVLYSSPVINLFNPDNDSTILIENVTFIFNASDINGIANVSLFIDGVLNETNSSGIEGNYSFLKTLIDGNYNWSVRAASILGKITNSITNIFTVHTGIPEAIITAPSGTIDYFKLGENETLVYNITESGASGDHFDECLYMYGEVPEIRYTDDLYIEGIGFANPIFLGFIEVTDNATQKYVISTPDVSDVSAQIRVYYDIANTSSYQTISGLITNFVDEEFDITVPNGFHRVVYYGGTFGGSKAKLDKFTIDNTTLVIPVDTLNCSANEQNFTYVIGQNNMTIFAVDEFDFTTNTTTTWEYSLIEISQTYPSSSVESATEQYVADLSYNNNEFSVITATLNLGGSSFLGSRSGTGNIANFTANAIMPGVNSTTNFTAYWTVSITNATNTYDYNLTAYNVTVTPINLSLCNAVNTIPFWNFTILNESNSAEINSTFEVTFDLKNEGSTSSNFFSFSDTTGLNSQFDFCISPGYESYDIDTSIELTASGFVTKFYNFENIIVTNATREDNLYMMTTTDSTSFIVHVVDTTATNVNDAEVRVQRYYSGTNEWITTEIITTNDVGTAVGHILSEDAFYRFRVYQSGVSVHNSSATQITCSISPCTVTLVIPALVSSGIEGIDNLTSTLVYDSNVFTYTYSDSSNLFSSARLYVIRLTPSNGTIVTPCNETKATSSGVLSCNIAGQVNGTYQATGYITRDSDEFLVVRITGTLGSEIHDAMGNDGVLWSIFVLIGMVMVGIKRPSLAIIFGILGFIVIGLIGMVNVGTISIVAVIAIGIILLVRVGTE